MGPELGAKDAAERSNRGGGGDDARGELGVGIALERRAFGVDVDADDVRAAREGKSRGGATGLSAGFGSGERAGRARGQGVAMGRRTLKVTLRAPSLAPW